MVHGLAFSLFNLKFFRQGVRLRRESDLKIPPASAEFPRLVIKRWSGNTSWRPSLKAVPMRLVYHNTNETELKKSIYALCKREACRFA